MAETEDKGFTVKDRRFFSQTEEEKARLREETREKPETSQPPPESEPKPESRTGPLPEINFSSFIISLSSSAFMHLGDIPNPATGKEEKDLALAKQTIDLLGMIREKTRNNLTRDEENLFDHLLTDLRLRYVKETSQSGV